MFNTLKKIAKNTSLLLPPIAKLYKHKNQLMNKVSSLETEVNRLMALRDTFQGTRKIFKETYIDWMKIGVIGWCTDRNIEIIDQCIAELPSGAVVEIGSYCGLSMSVIAHAMRLHQKKNYFYTVDDWYFEGYQKDTSVSNVFTTDEWRAHTEEMFKLAEKLAIKNIPHSHLKKNSNEFFEAWEKNEKIIDLKGKTIQLGGEIAFAYIDGDHSYEQSKKDFLNADKFLVPGGYIFFDDSTDNVGFGCKDIAKEVEHLPNYELVFQPADAKSNRCFLKKY